MMPDETRRYVNPRTLLIEFVTPAYAAQVGLLLWEGDTAATEVDKADVLRAVVDGPHLDDLLKEELEVYAAQFGLDTSGTKADIREAIAAFQQAACPPSPVEEPEDIEPDVPGAKVATEPVPLTTPDTKLLGKTAAGDDNKNTSSKEG